MEWSPWGGVHGGFGQTLKGWRVSGWVVGGMHKDGCMKIHPMYVELSWYTIWYMILRWHAHADINRSVWGQWESMGG